MTTGEKIAALRREKGLSQETLGEKLGLSRQAVSKWEADQAVPTMDNLMELSRLFGVPVDTLLRPDEPLPGKETAKELPDDVKIQPDGFKVTYAPALTKKTKWFIIAVALLLFVSVMMNIISIMQKQNYEMEVLHLQTQVQDLRQQVESIQANPNTVYVPTDGQTEPQSDLVDSQLVYMLDEKNPEQLNVSMSALPREVNEQEAPKFVIRSGTESWSCATWLDGVYSGTITIPLCDTFSAYLVLTAPDGTVRNLLVGTEYGVRAQYSFEVEPVWATGGISTSWGKSAVSGTLEIWFDSLMGKTWPVSGKVILLRNGKQIEEAPIKELEATEWDVNISSCIVRTEVNWTKLEEKAEELSVQVELTDNYGRVSTYPVE